MDADDGRRIEVTTVAPAELADHGGRVASGNRRLRQALAPLFPPPREAGRVRWRAVALGALTVAAGAGVSLTRQAGPGALDSVWAEDGDNLLTDALNRSPVDALTTPFNGYFHVLPRLLADLTTVFPIDWAAPVMSVAAAVTCAVLAVAVYLAAAAHVRSVLVRLLVAAPLVAAPVGQGGLGYHGGSVVNNLATLQFPLMYALFWLVLWTPAHRIGRIALVAAVLLTALSTPLAVIYLPLVGLRLLVRRDPIGWGLLSALVLGTAIQLGGLAIGVTSRSGIGQTRLDPLWVATEYARWSVPNALVGERWWTATLAHPNRHAALIALAWLVLGAAVIAAGIRLTAPRWALATAALALSIAITGVQLAMLGSTADRYLFAPGLLIIVGVAVLLTPTRPGWRAQLPAAGLAMVLLVGCAANWRVQNHRATARSWHDVVAAARAQCASTGAAGATVPTHASLGWRVVVPCRKLR